MSRRLGLGETTWQRLELEGRAPKGEVIAQLVEMGFSSDWLLTGEGEMRRGGLAEPASPVDLDVLRDCIEVLHDELRRRGRTLEPAQEAEALALLYGIAVPKPGQEPQPLDRGVVVRLLKFARQ